MYKLQWRWDLKMCPYWRGVLISEGGMYKDLKLYPCVLLQVKRTLVYVRTLWNVYYESTTQRVAILQLLMTTSAGIRQPLR